MSELVGDIEKLVTPVLEAAQVELVDLTYQKQPGGWTLCFYLDKATGVTLEDCQEWSGRLGALLDQSDLIRTTYNLEVSSPGLNRALRKTKDFQRFMGQNVHVKLFAPIDGQKNFHGTLTGASDETIALRLDDGRDVSLPRNQVAKSRLDPKIEI